MALISQPPTNQVVDATGVATTGWAPFFSAIFTLLTALTLSGITASRPTSLLYVGRPYFDTTLGIPIWLKSTGPTVWVNSAGVAV